MPTPQKRLGKAVARLRKARGYSQEGFAYHAGFERTYMGKVERGERDVQLSTLYRLADALEIPPWKLLREAEKG